jgi:large subunit ribosomal protein L32
MPNPKRRTSKSKKRSRRSLNPLYADQLVRCSHCSRNIRPHAVCDHCGYYRGKQILHIAG